VDEKAPIGNTFTGDFKVGAADALHGPFEGPPQVPMNHSLGVNPVEYPLVRSSKVCGSCHSVVLPVFDGDRPWVRAEAKKPEIIIEQATYPEWVFSDFRDGGLTPMSCQNCHMATSYPGLPGTLATKIASIQEASNMPQTENRQPQSEVDLKTRSPFARAAGWKLQVVSSGVVGVPAGTLTPPTPSLPASPPPAGREGATTTRASELLLD
jgi:hypothetical protein